MAAVVSTHYCTTRGVELTVSEKKKNREDSYEIADAQGNLVFEMQDDHTLTDICTLLDRDANPILSARKKLMNMHNTWEVSSAKYPEPGSLLFVVKKSSFFHVKTSLEVILETNKNRRSPDFCVKGNFSERDAQILEGDNVIAEVKPKISANNVILDKRVFCVEVKPHVDLAFIATLIIIMQQILDD